MSQCTSTRLTPGTTISPLKPESLTLNGRQRHGATTARCRRIYPYLGKSDAVLVQPGTSSKAMRRKSKATAMGSEAGHYVTAAVGLAPGQPTNQVCLDTGCNMTMIDREFLKQAAPDTEIRRMASPIPVRGLGANMHQTPQTG